MEPAFMYITGLAAIAFFVAGIYLHILRKRAERVAPPPFLNPARKRKPRK
jgi:uncharacterized iron-regulated membrane protein